MSGRNHGGNMNLHRFLKFETGLDKDNYPVPPMEQILQLIFGSEMFSLLDGFSGYNQVLVAEPD
jgi:hypothetical protein